MKIITFGEIMLRLATHGYQRLVQADDYSATYGGGEANVAVSLAMQGCEAWFVTKLPSHQLGQAAIDSLRKYGVKTDNIVRGGDRVGIYYLEKGASQRPSKVIYDRAHSAIATAIESDFDWPKILDGAAWLHWTGITPALGDNVVGILGAALRECKKQNIIVSCDLNYRKNLWSRDKAKSVMTKLMPYVNVCIANEEDAKDVFGIEAAGSDIGGGKLSYDGYKAVAATLAKEFGFGTVAITLRTSYSASDNDWAALLYTGKEHYLSKSYPIRIVDRVGGGDSFAAGLIYGLINKYTPQKALEYAVAASCLKHTIEGDYNLSTVSEITALMEGNSSGRVQR